MQGQGVTDFGWGDTGNEAAAKQSKSQSKNCEGGNLPGYNYVDPTSAQKTKDGSYSELASCPSGFSDVTDDLCFEQASSGDISRIQSGDSGSPWVAFYGGYWVELAAVHGTTDPTVFPGTADGTSVAGNRSALLAVANAKGSEILAPGPNTIVRNMATGNAWLVGSDGFRRSIPTGGDYLCFVAKGDPVINTALFDIETIPEQVGQQATCGGGLIVGNNASDGNGAIQTYDLTTGSLVNSFVPDGAKSSEANGRGVAVVGNEIFYTELTNLFGPSDGIHVAPFNNGAGGSDLRVLPNPAPLWGIQDLTYANSALYALTGYDSGPLQVWKLNPTTGSVISGPISVSGPDSGADGFALLPDGNFLINDGDASCTYRQYDSGTGLATGQSLSVPGGSQCTGVETDGTSLYFETNFNSFTKTDLAGNLISTTSVAENLVEDISLP
jgi:hypothetical protein